MGRADTDAIVFIYLMRSITSQTGADTTPACLQCDVNRQMIHNENSIGRISRDNNSGDSCNKFMLRRMEKGMARVKRFGDVSVTGEVIKTTNHKQM